MKILNTLFAAVLLLAGTLLFTGCEESNSYYERDSYFERYSWWNDSYRNPSNDLLLMAQTLRGHWQGDLLARGCDDSGACGEKSYSTDIEFDQYDSNAIYGRGIQSDFLKPSSTNPWTRRFSWHIDTWTKAIHIDYDNGYSMTISWSDFTLTDNSFSGTMRGANETDIFSLGRYTLAKKGSVDLSSESE